MLTKKTLKILTAIFTILQVFPLYSQSPNNSTSSLSKEEHYLYMQEKNILKELEKKGLKINELNNKYTTKHNKINLDNIKASLKFPTRKEMQNKDGLSRINKAHIVKSINSLSKKLDILHQNADSLKRELEQIEEHSSFYKLQKYNNKYSIEDNLFPEMFATLENNSPLYAEPSFNSDKLGSLNKNSLIRVETRIGSFYRIQTLDNKRGWIPTSAVIFYTKKPTSAIRIAGYKQNI